MSLTPFITTKPTGVGTGLGLSISYYIIAKSHSGKMEVFSEVGSCDIASASRDRSRMGLRIMQSGDKPMSFISFDN